MSNSTTNSSLVIGQRIVDKDGYRGTVRYIGPVAASKTVGAVYAGVEWDDQTRGKNDGSVTISSSNNSNGIEENSTVRYFTCAPNAGSFMKCELLFTGISLTEALNDRYVFSETDSWLLKILFRFILAPE